MGLRALTSIRLPKCVYVYENTFTKIRSGSVCGSVPVPLPVQVPVPIPVPVSLPVPIPGVWVWEQS